jgi:hypothetical protein
MRVWIQRNSFTNDGLLAHCPLCSRCGLDSWRFGLLRCAGCGLVVNPALFHRGAGQELNEEAFGEGWEPETSFWVRWLHIWKNRWYLRPIRRFARGGGWLLEVGGGKRSVSRARPGRAST